MLELIQVRGYSGTGLNVIVEQSGAPKGSMYFHFPEGKEQLAERAIMLAEQRFRDLITSATASEASPRELVKGLIDAFAALLVDSDYQLGCPVSVVTLEMGAHSERLRTACARAYESWIAATAEYLAALGYSDEEARQLGTAMVSTVEGAMIVARAQRDPEPLYSAGYLLSALLDQKGN
ncbi:TetR family transcriptional regulator [Nocardia camponoti]|uniref:TetR family transcriptional regulator n=2 Tax=Nocardia camponoti TaxID=1616106 RepID=A0A917V3N0_9NOCA|nr:TetR family transcriptional regulator [Nocardia camponoti]